MPFRSYKVFSINLDKAADAPSPSRPVADDLKLERWTPSWRRILPYRHAPKRFALWWALDRFGLFRNRQYTVVLVTDSAGSVVHRTCVFPGSLRTPFIGSDTVEVGDIWTHPSYRRQGLATMAMHETLRALPIDVRKVYYLADSHNFPSHALATSSQFKLAGTGKRDRKLEAIAFSSAPETSSSPPTSYAEVTELAGDLVSSVQMQRLIQRYCWALSFCAHKDVVDVACGSGSGLGLFGEVAKSVVAGDIDFSILARCRRHYGNRFSLTQWDAQQLPLEDQSADVIILFEALYYFPQPANFFRECRRVLRRGGHLLISMPNADLFDFHRSPLSHHYYSPTELAATLREHGFHVRLFGGDPYSEAGYLQRLSRPFKALAARHNLIPGSMLGKRLLRRIIHGPLTPLKAELSGKEGEFVDVSPLDDHATREHYRIIYAHGTLS